MKITNIAKTVRCDLFFKAWKKIKPFNNYEVTIEVPAKKFGDDEMQNLEMIIRSAPIGKGTYQTGVFQVQTEYGIYTRKDNREVRLIDWERGCSSKLVQFKTWKQLVKEETKIS
jgi:hypothetical protein